jgi:hypothetical protein
MITIDRGDVVYSFRWPWRVTPAAGGFYAQLPWWGRPYRWLVRLLGIQLFKCDWKPRPEKTFPTLADRGRSLLREA